MDWKDILKRYDEIDARIDYANPVDEPSIQSISSIVNVLENEAGRASEKAENQAEFEQELTKIINKMYQNNESVYNIRSDGDSTDGLKDALDEIGKNDTKELLEALMEVYQYSDFY